MQKYSLAELDGMETLHSGQYYDLKYEDEDTRVWLSRMTADDGEEYDNKVTVEKLQDGKWVTVDEYQAESIQGGDSGDPIQEQDDGEIGLDDVEEAMIAVIDGDKYEDLKVKEDGPLPMIMAGNKEWYVAQDEAAAGDAAKEYWRDIMENDPEWFRGMMGDDVLVSWSMGQPAGPGSLQARNASEWLEMWKDNPAEQWASVDGNQTDIEVSERLREELGWDENSGVAYRRG